VALAEVTTLTVEVDVGELETVEETTTVSVELVTTLTGVSGGDGRDEVGVNELIRYRRSSYRQENNQAPPIKRKSCQTRRIKKKTAWKPKHSPLI
jgi:hypothetical protein